MTERERILLRAAKNAQNAIRLMAKELTRLCPKSERENLKTAVAMYEDDLVVALAAYSEPPNEVFSQEVAWDSRAPASDASLGHRKNFGMEEG
jgi:hypothetical protein